MRLGSPTSKAKLRVRLVPFDLFWAVVAPILALALRDPSLLDSSFYPYTTLPAYEYALVTTASAIPAFLLFRISEGMSRFFSVHDVLAACGAVATTIASSSLILFVFTRLEGVPRSTPLICGLVMGGGLLFGRTLARVFHGEGRVEKDEAFEYAAYSNVRRVLLIGVDRFAAIAIKLIDTQTPRTTHVVAALDSRPSHVGRTISGVKIVGLVEDLDVVIDEYFVHGVDIDEVWLSDEAAPAASGPLLHLTELCAARGLRLVRIAEALNLTPATVDNRATTAQREAAQALQASNYFRLKRVIDIVVVSVLLIALLPVALIVACLTLLDVGAPVLFWQQRAGKNGRKFLLYKFRTFQAPFDALGARIPEERRLSKIGRAIRAVRLDELPQLMNVLVGDMSLIGPRPLLPQDQPADPRLRLMVRPGVTGWAQINGGTIITTEQKDALDAWYIQHASLRLDLEIIALTLRFIFTGEKLNSNTVEQAMRFREAASAAARVSARETGSSGATASGQDELALATLVASRRPAARAHKAG